MSTQEKIKAYLVQISIFMCLLLVAFSAGCRLDVQQVEPLATRSKTGVTTEDRAMTPEQFALLKPGMNESQVIEILGTPKRGFLFWAKPGTTPVHLSHVDPDIGCTDFLFCGRGGEAPPPRDELGVLEYKGPWSWRPYFVVLRDSKVFYSIGPVPDDERDPETVRKRYGRPDIHIEDEQGHGGRTMELFTYPEKGIAFLRRPGKKEFDAKLVRLVKSEDINRDLIDAANVGRTAAVQALLKAGADVNAKNTAGETALMRVAFRGHTDTARALLKAGADVNWKHMAGLTVLMAAAVNGHTGTVRAFLEAGADINAKDKAGMTALMNAAMEGRTSTLQALLKAGADINAKTKRDKTALIVAALKGHTDAVRALLEAGANINATSEHGGTALMFAAYRGRTDAVQVLLGAGADIHAEAKDGYTALTLAADYGHTDVVELLENSIAKRRQTQTMEAAKEEDGTRKQLMEVTDENFVEEVEKSKQLVMVLFDGKTEDASRCRPCRVIAPIVEQLARAYAGQVKAVRIEAETNPKTSARFRIIGVPAILFFKNGKLVDKEIGEPPRARKILEGKVEEHLD